MNDPHIKTEAKGNRQKARELARRLHMPPGELLHVITCAGLAAIEQALTLREGVTFPLEFEAVGKDSAEPDMGQSFLIETTEPETLPVYLPAAMVKKLNAMGECIGLENGAASYITEIITNDLEPDSNGGAADILLSLWEITDPEAVAALYRIQAAEASSFTSHHPEEEAGDIPVDWDAIKAEKGLPADMTYREYRIAFVRGVARSHGMNEEEMIREVILD